MRYVLRETHVESRPVGSAVSRRGQTTDTQSGTDTQYGTNYGHPVLGRSSRPCLPVSRWTHCRGVFRVGSGEEVPVTSRTDGGSPDRESPSSGRVCLQHNILAKRRWSVEFWSEHTSKEVCEVLRPVSVYQTNCSVLCVNGVEEYGFIPYKSK